MGFKEREREGSIEFDQVEGRKKACKFKQFEITTKVRKTQIFTKFVSILPFMICYMIWTHTWKKTFFVNSEIWDYRFGEREKTRKLRQI